MIEPPHAAEPPHPALIDRFGRVYRVVTDETRAAAQGRAPDAAQRQGLLNWLRWLQSANVQKDVTFMEEEATLREGLRRGRFDWISCSSSDLPMLQRICSEAQIKLCLDCISSIGTVRDSQLSRAAASSRSSSVA